MPPCVSNIRIFAVEAAVAVEMGMEMRRELRIKMKYPQKDQRKGVMTRVYEDVVQFSKQEESVALRNSQIHAHATLARHARKEQRESELGGKSFPAILCRPAPSAFVSMHALSQLRKA